MVEKAAVCEMLKQKKISRNLQLVIYFSGLPLEDLNEVEQLFGDATGSVAIKLSYIVENFKRFGLVDLIRNVNYNDLLVYSSQLSVDAFLSKFIRIEQVEVSACYEPYFVEFIKKCKELKKLTIDRARFSQMFYYFLHTFCASLKVLIINEEPWLIGNLNLKFLFNHRKLRHLALKRRLNFTIVSGLIRQRPSITLDFLLNSKPVRLVQNHWAWHLEFGGQRFRLADMNGLFNGTAALNALFNLVE